VLRALVAAYPLTKHSVSLGHKDFDYPRKEDPGPLWMNNILPRIVDRVFGA
jgi:N-acetyl-anhydromuramyl-L-alanine amidase AmpD